MENFTREDLEKALKTIASVVHKIKKAQKHFPPGTSQHTLAANRLQAFGIASELIEDLLGRRQS